MTPRNLILISSIILSSCLRKPQQFSTPTENDRSILFPVSVGRGLVGVEAGKETYELMDGEVLRALMVAANDYIPPGISNPPCWARIEALTYRFTRRDDIIFVYIDENFEYCGRKLKPMHSGAKYAISKDGRILRRVIDGVHDDEDIWRLNTPDGGTVTVITEPGVVPDLEDLGKPDSGILKIVTEPVNMPGVMLFEQVKGFQPLKEGPGVVPGMSFFPLKPPTAPTSDPDGGTPGDAGPGSLNSPPSPPDAGASAP